MPTSDCSTATLKNTNQSPPDQKTRRRVANALILVGFVVIFFPFSTEIYGYMAQSRLNKQWDNQVAAQERQALKAQERQITRLGSRVVTTEETVLKAVVGPLAKAKQQNLPATRIKIPKIGVEQVVLTGVGPEVLKNGPGHYSGTALPGQRGNVGVAGHRVTYTHPFNRLDELVPGDIIVLETLDNIYEYSVAWSKTLSPDDVSALMPTEDARLTLTTCTPKYSAKQRLDVQAVLVKTTSRRPPTLLHRLIKRVAQPKEEPLPKNALDFAVNQGKENVSKNPNNPEARLYLGIVYRSIGKYDDAIAQLNKAIELDGGNPQGHYELSVVYERAGQTSKAIDELTAAVEHAPNFEAAYYRLGNLYLQNRQADLAIPMFEKALALSPFSGDTHYCLGKAFEKEKKKDLAIYEYQAAIKFVPDHPEANAALKRMNKKPRKPRKSIEW